MKKQNKNHDCFICKHSTWEHYYDAPAIRELYCKKGHEKTSYNTKHNETFICTDYQHSYFSKAYIGYWILGIWATIIILMTIYLKTR